MAKCDLSIELDQPDQIHTGGGTISGVVRVNADADVNCNALTVTSVWRTHGRGNVDSGEVGSHTLFSGQWRAGEQAEYRFELPIGQWPPSYHGHYLNIDHYVDARANIPWAFDAKASAPFLMRPGVGAGTSIAAAVAAEKKSFVGCAIIALIMAGIGFAVTAVVAGPLLCVLVPIALAIGGLWLFRFVLPKFALGDVAHQLAAERIAPGQTFDGTLTIRPRKNVRINGISVTFQAREQCVSGSGSNRTTHKHVFFERTESLSPAMTLNAGVEQRFPIQLTLPENAPYSVDLDDNDLIWSAKLRVDIPRWPDWTTEIPVQVLPSEVPSPRDDLVAATMPIGASVSPANSVGDAAAGGDDEITFAETATHLWNVRDDRAQVEALVAAVSGLSFQLEAEIERRLLYAGDDDPHLDNDGYAVWAHYPQPELPLVLYVPHELADEFEQIGRDNWRGRGTIVGWDSLHGRLQIKLDRRSG